MDSVNTGIYDKFIDNDFSVLPSALSLSHICVSLYKYLATELIPLPWHVLIKESYYTNNKMTKPITYHICPISGFKYKNNKMWYDCQWDNSPQETKMTGINNYRSPYGLQQWAKPIPHIQL